MELLLEGLEHRDAEFRFTNARRLLYVLQGITSLLPISTPGFTQFPEGTFAETTSPEHQLHWIFENCKVVRAANGMSNIVEAMKIACSKHDLLWYCTFFFQQAFPDSLLIASPSSLSDADAAHLNITASQKSDFMEEVTTELSVYLGMLYHMVEIFKGHDDFADELSES